jgi:hypothetical protein
MATRSRIGVMHGDVCKSVYCHWDGYLEHNGKILQESYDSAKANHLVSLGDLSSLRPEIGDKHDFSHYDSGYTLDEYNEVYGEMCTFYGRDRGETGYEFQSDSTFAAFLERANGCGAEYYYIMKDGVWYVGTTYNSDSAMGGKLVPLTEALAATHIEEAELA